MRLPLFAVAAMLAASLAAHADTITLDSHVGDEFTYAILVDTPTTFVPGGLLFLTGLSGVSNATLSGSLVEGNLSCCTISFTDDSVSINSLYTFVDQPTILYGDINVFSSATTTGTVSYELGTKAGTLDGTVLGPVASTPEPSNLVLVSTGLLGIAGVMKRGFASVPAPQLT